MDIVVRRSLQVTALLAVVTALMLILCKKILWAEGFFIGASWSTLNFLLTLRLLKAILLGRDKGKLFIMCLVKFPVLYLIGFLILISKFFPVYSLFAGVPLILVVTGATKLCLKQG